jgi:phosphoserine phosphatase RsbU/P
MGPLQNLESRVFRRIRRNPPSGLAHRGAFWLFVFYFVLSVPGWLPGETGTVFRDLANLDFFLLIFFCAPLLWRYVFGQLLWKVRNRLIVTYLLMGLTPVVLFVTLALLLLYVFSGQFAIYVATSVVDEELSHITAQTGAVAMHIAHELDNDPGIRSLSLPEAGDDPADHEYTGMTLTAFHDGKSIGILPTSVEAHDISGLPAWLSGDFQGVVTDHGQLWLRSVAAQELNGHRTIVITSVPLQQQNVEAIARNLGRVSISYGVESDKGQDQPAQHRATFTTSSDSPEPGLTHVDIGDESLEHARKNAIVGGLLPPPLHFYDVPVGFLAPLSTRNWVTGHSEDIFAYVMSRPSLLYRVLFSTSLEIGNVVRDALIAVAIAFGVLELLAFLAAVRLNQTITRSVHDLYEATVAIDGGNLDHRITVKRRDQLGALSRSFNNMAASLERLLAEQREKERLQNELAIAQEVQANLFPRGRVALPMLELHGVCLPARTVSGDYYDFLLFGETGLGMALGDISGKGISAALLMATLHSAVRAYRFAGEELLTEGAAALANPRTSRAGEHEGECGELFEEPAKILALLNRHLYRSTQPEKYATLFLAHYDGATRRLVYSNGGHLPPLLLRANDTVTRLDRGGSVVGLLDELSWQQGTEHLGTGDILIAYSDGVTEPENDFGEFGEERLLEVVRRHRHLGLEAISEQVIQTLRSWIGAQEQPDDVTLVLARQR